MKKQIQFELWPDCNTGCKFCYLGNKTTDNDFKLKAIDFAFNKLFNIKENEFETVGFIGGEFFQGQLKNDIKIKFKQLISLCNDLLLNKYINYLWISASMIVGDQSDLYEVLEILKSNINKVWILTSFDTIGRFKTQNQLINWETNMAKLKQIYPDINLNTTMILTKHLMTGYLENSINFELFKQKYKCDLYFKAPDIQRSNYKNNIDMNKSLPLFFPDRETTINFFIKLKKDDKQLWDKLFDIEYRADILVKNINEEVVRDKSNYNELYNNENHLMKCGHFYSYNSYENEDGCILCDKLKIASIGEDNG